MTVDWKHEVMQEEVRCSNLLSESWQETCNYRWSPRELLSTISLVSACKKVLEYFPPPSQPHGLHNYSHR